MSCVHLLLTEALIGWLLGPSLLFVGPSFFFLADRVGEGEVAFSISSPIKYIISAIYIRSVDILQMVIKYQCGRGEMRVEELLRYRK